MQNTKGVSTFKQHNLKFRKSFAIMYTEQPRFALLQTKSSEQLLIIIQSTVSLILCHSIENWGKLWPAGADCFRVSMDFMPPRDTRYS